MSFMLSVANKPNMLNVVTPSLVPRRFANFSDFQVGPDSAQVVTGDLGLD
jgi:hypothetical protein